MNASGEQEFDHKFTHIEGLATEISTVDNFSVAIEDLSPINNGSIKRGV